MRGSALLASHVDVVCGDSVHGVGVAAVSLLCLLQI